MNCDECRELLPEYVDHEVGEAREAALRGHLVRCPECSRLHRQLSKFSTTMLQSVRPLRLSDDFTGKVLSQYEVSRTERERKAVTLPPPARTYPLWPWALGILVLLFLGSWWLSSREAPIASLQRGLEGARILSYRDGRWLETPGPQIHSGDRVEAVGLPGSSVEIAFHPDVRIWLRAPGSIQVDHLQNVLRAIPLPGNTGPLCVRTRPGANPRQAGTLRIQYKDAWVDVATQVENCVGVEPGRKGELAVCVLTGSAQAGNRGKPQPLAQGYAFTLPQEGSPTPPVQVDPHALEWCPDH